MAWQQLLRQRILLQKSANVKLIGYELTKGYGMVTIKIEGDVSAETSAINAAKISASSVNKVCSTLSNTQDYQHQLKKLLKIRKN